MKKEYNRIILAIDGSKRSMKAAEKGIFIAKNLDLDVLAIYVLDKNIFEQVIPSNRAFEHWRSMLADEGHKSLNKIAEMGEEKDVKINTLLLEGKPDVELLKNIKEEDLVVMGSKGKSAMDRILLGSITEKVMHHSNSSIMIVK